MTDVVPPAGTAGKTAVPIGVPRGFPEPSKQKNSKIVPAGAFAVAEVLVIVWILV